MKRFHSTATRLLRVARQRQRLCELLLARAQAADAQAQARIRQAEQHLADGEQSLGAMLESLQTAFAVHALQSHLQLAQTGLQKMRAERLKTAEQVAFALQELQLQQGRTRSLERLEQRAFEEHRREAARDQESIQDEQRLRKRWLQANPPQQVTHG